MEYIAEIGWNFIGDLELAKNMIHQAKRSGATIAKFQLWDPQKLKAGDWDTDGRREIYHKAFLTPEKLTWLKSTCEDAGIEFLCSVFNVDSAQILIELGEKKVKVPSHECYNFELIDFCVQNFEQVYLSIGALTEEELNALTQKYANEQRILPMHCVSTYPLDAEKINFPKLTFLQGKFGRVGYSSHYQGTIDAAISVGLGAQVIEKHFTTDHDLPGRDNKFALLPEDFAQMVEYCDTASAMMTDLGNSVQACEENVFTVMRGRWSDE